ncbi:MAG TPA: aromatase/cyclase [Streptosporangiaceae bacterium]|nr:aromatase/cyclase [Streptosporangiaceae bacterium]
MSQPVSREVEHEITVRAPAGELYQFIADVENWPRLFPPTVHVECLERSDNSERIQIWATANGEAKTWTSRRVLDPDRHRVGFRQEKSQPPVGAMGGTWIIEPDTDGQDAKSRVRLLHNYRAVDDDPDHLAWIDSAVDRNSQAELGALKAGAELAANSADLLLSFCDSVDVHGTAKDVFDFINEAQLWTQRLPHVSRVMLREDTPGLQFLAMDTKTKDGSVHTTESVRVTFPHSKIVYKQIKVPPLMTLHTGEWLISENDDGVTVSSSHDVAINEANIAKFLGQSATIADARSFIKDALSGNSMTTLRHAKRYAEAAGGDHE